MKLAKGVLLVLDANAMPFRRIWCNFEIDKTIIQDMQYLDRGKMLDIATKNNKIRLLTSRPLPGEQLFDKSNREQKFPLSLLSSGLEVQLENGRASVAKDKDRKDGCYNLVGHSLIN